VAWIKISSLSWWNPGSLIVNFSCRPNCLYHRRLKCYERSLRFFCVAKLSKFVIMGSEPWSPLVYHVSDQSQILIMKVPCVDSESCRKCPLCFLSVWCKRPLNSALHGAVFVRKYSLYFCHYFVRFTTCRPFLLDSVSGLGCVEWDIKIVEDDEKR